MNGDFALSLERSQTIARFALNVVRYNLPEDYYQTYLGRLQNVTKEDVQNAAKKYIDPNNCIILVVGNKEVAESLKKFDSDGEIEFYDVNGDKEKMEEIPLPEGVTAKMVIEEMGLFSKINYTGGDRGWLGDVPEFKYNLSKIMTLAFLN